MCVCFCFRFRHSLESENISFDCRRWRIWSAIEIKMKELWCAHNFLLEYVVIKTKKKFVACRHRQWFLCARFSILFHLQTFVLFGSPVCTHSNKNWKFLFVLNCHRHLNVWIACKLSWEKIDKNQLGNRQRCRYILVFIRRHRSIHSSFIGHHFMLLRASFASFSDISPFGFGCRCKWKFHFNRNSIVFRLLYFVFNFASSKINIQKGVPVLQSHLILFFKRNKFHLFTQWRQLKTFIRPPKEYKNMDFISFS